MMLSEGKVTLDQLPLYFGAISVALSVYFSSPIFKPSSQASEPQPWTYLPFLVLDSILASRSHYELKTMIWISPTPILLLSCLSLCPLIWGEGGWFFSYKESQSLRLKKEWREYWYLKRMKGDEFKLWQEKVWIILGIFAYWRRMLKTVGLPREIVRPHTSVAGVWDWIVLPPNSHVNVLTPSPYLKMWTFLEITTEVEAQPLE